MGVGYEYVDQALNGGLLLKTMAIAVFPQARRDDRVVCVGQRRRHLRAQPVHRGHGGRRGRAWSCIGSRHFRPAIPGAYALVGMGTLFAGIIRAPMTSVFMIFEITQDYQILVPLMVANMLSFAISKRYQPVPVYHALLQQDGVHLPLPATQALTAGRTARHVMQTDVSLIPPDASVEQAWQMTVEHAAPAYLVGTRDRLVGSVSHQQLDDSVRSGKARGLRRVDRRSVVRARARRSADRRGARALRAERRDPPGGESRRRPSRRRRRSPSTAF